MRPNRSVPASSVIPVLAYPDVTAASDWLCDAFGFRERLRVGDHRAQLIYGNGAVIVTQGESAPATVHVRVEDAVAHHEHAYACGAEITSEPADYPYGERQYTAVDPGGRPRLEVAREAAYQLNRLTKLATQRDHRAILLFGRRSQHTGREPFTQPEQIVDQPRGRNLDPTHDQRMVHGPAAAARR